MLKVIGGIYKSRLLNTPKASVTRPTSALVRKAVFDRCQIEIQGARFLDLYAGSGAMGIEALSRGASSATFVDRDRLAIRCIYENLEKLGIETAVVLQIEGLKAIRILQKKGALFELIYIDPPYAEDPTTLLEKIDQAALLTTDGKLFLETRISSLKVDSLLHLRLIDMRKFNDTILFTFRFK